jgi:hypothetical protein
MLKYQKKLLPMKKWIPHLKILSTFAFCFYNSFSFSQSLSNSWMLNPYDERVFIQNNGQFASLEERIGVSIRYCFEQGNTIFFLCNDRIVVQLREQEDQSIEESEKEDPATSKYPAPSFTYLTFLFGSASPSSSIVGEEPARPIHKYFWPDISGKNTLIQAPVFSKGDL